MKSLFIIITFIIMPLTIIGLSPNLENEELTSSLEKIEQNFSKPSESNKTKLSDSDQIELLKRNKIEKDSTPYLATESMLQFIALYSSLYLLDHDKGKKSDADKIQAFASILALPLLTTGIKFVNPKDKPIDNITGLCCSIIPITIASSIYQKASNENNEYSVFIAIATSTVIYIKILIFEAFKK